MALPKSGITSQIVADIQDGPSRNGGGGVLSLFHFQGTSRTSMIVEQVSRDTSTGKLLLTCIEDLVLEWRLYGSLWQIPFHHLHRYMQQHSLIFHVYAYNYANKVTIANPHGELKPQRDGDASLMIIAINIFGTTKALRSIQRVRSLVL